LTRANYQGIIYSGERCGNLNPKEQASGIARDQIHSVAERLEQDTSVVIEFLAIQTGWDPGFPIDIGRSYFDAECRIGDIIGESTVDTCCGTITRY